MSHTLIFHRIDNSDSACRIRWCDWVLNGDPQLQILTYEANSDPDDIPETIIPLSALKAYIEEVETLEFMRTKKREEDADKDDG